MELVIFHYHLLPGGVTGVIEQATRALASRSDAFERVRIVTGLQPEKSSFPEGVAIEVMPSIGYISRQGLASLASGDDGDGDGDRMERPEGPIGQVAPRTIAAGTAILAARVARELLERFGGAESVWWVHNHHLGKNPAFTGALGIIATQHPHQPIVLHVHDFPECGRYDNLRFLSVAGVSELYPRGPQVRYATINSRDRDILIEAGIDDVVYLPNPVAGTGRADTAPPPASTPPITALQTREALRNAYGVDFPRFDHGSTIFLYPVRSIRRKNILEAALLVMLREDPTQLIVTLPGVSQSEKQYSAMVENAFRDGTIPGLFGIGATNEKHGISFDQLQEAADLIVSSSIQEGFGYQYISPLLLGKPLVARQLDIMRDILPLYEDHPNAFYASISVPMPTPSLSGPQALLRFRYEERIDRLASSVPAAVIEKLYTKLDTVIRSDSIEISYLLPHIQYVVLRDIRRDAGYRSTVKRANSDLLAQIDKAAGAEATKKGDLVEAAFGLTRHAQGITQIAESALIRTQPTNVDTDSILARFADLEYQRLLYE